MPTVTRSPIEPPPGRSPSRRIAGRRKVVVAALTAVVVTLSACSSAEPNVAPSGPGDMANRDPDAVYRFSWSQSPTTFDPDRITSGVLETFAYPVYDTLVHLNPAGELVPMLAQSWEVLDDGKALQLSLIEGW